MSDDANDGYTLGAPERYPVPIRSDGVKDVGQNDTLGHLADALSRPEAIERLDDGVRLAQGIREGVRKTRPLQAAAAGDGDATTIVPPPIEAPPELAWSAREDHASSGRATGVRRSGPRR